MIHRLIRYSLLGAVAIGLTACVSQPPRDLANLPGKNACFWTRYVFGWTVLNDTTLIVNAPTDQQPYLVKLLEPIPGLGFNERIGFQNGPGTIGQFCPNSYIIVRGPGPQRSAAVAVRALTTTEARQMIARSHQPKTHREAAAAGATPTG